MSFGLSDTLRNLRLKVIRDAIDGGSGPGVMKIYSAPRPAKGAAPTGATLLVTSTWQDPCGADPTGGLLTLNLPADADPAATGTAAWARMEASDGTFVADATVTATGGGGEIQLGNVSVQVGTKVKVTSATLTEGNA